MSSKKKPQYGLRKTSFARPVQDYVDMDYIEKLSPEEKAWLNNFNQGYYGGKAELLYPDNTEKRREIWRENNSRNRDLYALASASNRLVSSDAPTKAKGTQSQDTSKRLTRKQTKRRTKDTKEDFRRLSITGEQCGHYGLTTEISSSPENALIEAIDLGSISTTKPKEESIERPTDQSSRNTTKPKLNSKLALKCS